MLRDSARSALPGTVTQRKRLVENYQMYVAAGMRPERSLAMARKD